MLSRPLRALGATLGLALLLGCSGMFGDDDEDGVAEVGETGDTGDVDDEEEDEGEEDDAEDSAPVDTGRKRKPRDGKRGKRDRKEREKPGGGRDGKKKPKPKPKPQKPNGKSMCFGGGGLDLQLSMDGTDVKGSLKLSGKADVTVKKLTGKRKGARVEASGSGTVNGKKKKVSVRAGKGDGGPVVEIDGRKVKGAKIVPCP